LLSLSSFSIFAQQIQVPKPLLGIGMSNGTKTYQQLIRKPNNLGAILVKKVLVDSAADEAGLKKGDILYSINDKRLKKDEPVKFFKSILEQFQTGEKIVIKGLRFKKHFQVKNKVYPTFDEASQSIMDSPENELTIKKIFDIQSIEKELILGSWQKMPKLTHQPDSINPNWLESVQNFQQKYSKHLLPNKTHSSKFQSKMEENASINIPGADPLEFYLHKNPHMLLATGLHIKDFAFKNNESILEALLTNFYTQDVYTQGKQFPLALNGNELSEQLIHLVQDVKTHNIALEKFYNDFKNPINRLKLYYQSQDDSDTPTTDPEFHKNLEQISILANSHQHQSNQLLLKLHNYFNNKTVQLLMKLFNDKDLPKRLEVNDLLIVISGTTNDNHYQGADMIIDLGGDDNYFVTQTSQSKPIIVDMSGNDIYMSQIPHQWGATQHGISYLLELEGNDHYIGADFSLGSAFNGAALLVDKQGDDSYSAAHLSLGVGLLGVGILSDKQGNDTYLSGTISQAAGLFMGQGYLIEKNGNDRYVSSAWRQGAYQQEDSFDGISMGVGFGLRDVSRGGVGILFDYQGDDYYHGGNFSLGCGYYFGVGGLIDLAGNDNYQAMRYGIGAAAHSASGFFLDSSGNDQYSSTQHAIAGAAWDLSSAAFFDHAGDDKYMSSGPFSFAAADHNSLAIHLDNSGNDSYQKQFYTEQSNSYNDGQSFGFFYNTKGQDIYPAPFLNNNKQQINGFYFIDRQ